MNGAVDIAEVLESGLFDLAWYRTHCPSAPTTPEAAVRHFLDHGVAEGIDPGPEFSVRRYLQANPDVAAAGIDPLLHYLRHGRAEGRASFPAGAAGTMPAPDPARQARELGALRGSALFDADFYLDHYPDVREAGADPLRHFVEHGAREGRWPNPWFDTGWYRARYQELGDDANPLAHYAASPGSDTAWTSEWFDGSHYWSRYMVDADVTPLEHFLMHGIEPGRETRQESPASARGRIPDPGAVRATVVVTVHDAPDHVAACLDSVLRHTRLGDVDSLLVIDDASTDPAVAKVLARIDGAPGVRVVRNEHNLGYTRTANLGCRLAAADDVVLLNSDTVVGPHWLRNLKIAACRRTRIGTVTPVSDNAGAFSVPREGRNALPPGVSPEPLARAVADAGAGDFEVPTGNGFCLYLRRAMLDAVGGFDEQAFPVGYGEENDLCMRALAAGWHHLVAPTVFVRHARSASFGARRELLAHAARERLQVLHPGYDVAAGGITALRGFVLARYRIARKWRALASGQLAPRPRLLFVLSTDNGGIPHSNADLMRALEPDFDCLALRCEGRTLTLSVVDDGGYRVIEQHRLAEPLGFATHVGEEYEAIIRDLLFRHSIELLHVRHLAWHSLNLADVAHRMDVPVVHSLHDFYAVCPSVNLVDRHGRFHPTGIGEGGDVPLWPFDQAANHPMDRGRLRQWQAGMERALLAADARVTSSKSARTIMLAALPGIARAGADIEVIPHGRDFDRFHALADSAAVGGGDRLRILVPGNIGLHKGSALLADIAERSAGALELHLLGTADEALMPHVVDHGPYAREEFAERVAGIRPHLALVLSLAPETWCHVLTECWACGVPVLGVDRGAVGERIREHGGGWLVEPDAAAVLARLMALRGRVDDRREAIDAVARWQQGPGKAGNTRQMAARYRALYDTACKRLHRTFP